MAGGRGREEARQTNIGEDDAEVLVSVLVRGDKASKAVRRAAAIDRIRRTAREGLEATKPCGREGRASFLGERSIGHLDPGAQASCLRVWAVQRG
jgi:dihydroxyacetone kinase